MKKHFAHYGLYYFIIFLSLFFGKESLCQGASPNDIVGIKVKTSGESNRNGIVEADIILEIKKGWHINADKPLDDYLTPTVVSIKDTVNVNLISIKYPPPLLSKLKFSGNELALYENEAVIKLQLRIKKGFKKLSLKINGGVQYQPCNDQTCLFPVSKPFSIELKFKKAK